MKLKRKAFDINFINKSIIALFVWGLLNSFNPIYADTYYVAPYGNDNNPGTEVQPWLTIQKAANTLIAGDTVYVKTGTYNEQVIPQNSGSPGNYITYLAYPGDTVTINGTGIPVPIWYGVFDITDKSYIEVSGLRVINSTYAGIIAWGSSHIIIEKNYTYNTVSSGIASWESSNIIIDSNEVELACNDGLQECITVAVTDTFEVKNNHVHHGGPGTNGGEGIDIKDGSSNGKVYKNHVHDMNMNRLGIYVDAWDKHTYNIEVFQNIVHHCAHGIIVASEAGGLLENVRIYNNIAYNNEEVGIWIANWSSAQQQPMKDIKVINNTLYNNGNVWGGGINVMNSDAENVVIRNNICSQNLSFQIVIEDAPQNLIVDHNLIDGYMGYWGEIYGSDSVVGNPMFVNPLEADFHLLEGSPAINSGSSDNAPDFDFDGNPRPQGAGYDIGAYEYVDPIAIHENINQNPSLLNIYPNPFSRSTFIDYQLPIFAKVNLKIYDITGQEIRTLVNKKQAEGKHSVVWDGKDDTGKLVGSGIYFCKLKSKTHNKSGKIIKILFCRQ
ncbi:MAG: right-handed parallel beta-helix repeat-containing protein [Bacteroidales bacterium]|nr:right-handed parallel beta-helix repeat-containing protein [Bacteroidales bacterium]